MGAWGLVWFGRLFDIVVWCVAFGFCCSCLGDCVGFAGSCYYIVRLLCIVCLPLLLWISVRVPSCG